MTTTRDHIENLPVIKRPAFDLSRFSTPSKLPQVRNQREDLIEQIVAQCEGTEKQKRTLARIIAIAANTAKWGTEELHALLKKRQDPTIRNYTAFVRWTCKVRKAGK